MNSIQIEGLYKSYGKVNAVSNLSFQVKEGEFFAFLGVNGAGKSTTISILCGQLQKDGGRVEINGKEVDENDVESRRDLGVVFQNSVLDKSLSVYDNLKIRSALYGMDKATFQTRLEELKEKFELEGILSRPVGKLSGGQKRKVDLARAILHRPKILILDEPTTGLDPQTRRSVWNVVDELRKTEKMTVFLTTHYMEEAADADYVVILDGGKIAAEGAPRELKNKYTGDFIFLYDATEEDVKRLEKPYQKEGNCYRVQVENAKSATELIVRFPEIFNDYEIAKGKMDDVFLAVTGKKLEGGKE